MKRVLLIGGGGFVGSHLCDRLLRDGDALVFATHNDDLALAREGVDYRSLNLLAPEGITSLLCEVKPDWIVHLAAQSSVAVSWKRPQLTADVNVKGTINLLEAIRDCAPDARVLLVGSSEQYGPVAEKDNPIDESAPLHPANVYAVTKATQEMLGSVYAQAYDMQIVMTRSFNHFGPRQPLPFAIPSFCKQVAEVEAGLREPVLRVGNLAARRDFTDVRDVVEAYVLLLESGKPGETYNVGSGHAVPMSDMLDAIVGLAKVSVSVEVDPELFRAVDVPLVEADTSKIAECTGWRPTRSIMDSLNETLDWWRSSIAHEENRLKG